MILYMVEANEGGGLWLAHHRFSAETRREAADERDEFMCLYPYYKPRDVRIAKYECARIERKAKRGAKR